MKIPRCTYIGGLVLVQQHLFHGWPVGKWILRQVIVNSSHPLADKGDTSRKSLWRASQAYLFESDFDLLVPLESKFDHKPYMAAQEVTVDSRKLHKKGFQILGIEYHR